MFPHTLADLPLPHDPPPSFTVELRREFSQTADRCEIWLEVRGSRFFTGHAALEQAEEVRKVVSAVTAQGVPRDAVRLADVRVDSKTGVFTTSSEAAYTLRVELADLSKLADLLTAVTAPKTCRALRTEFRFAEDEAVADAWVAEALRDCRRRAEALAAAAGVTLGPVREITHDVARERIRSNQPAGGWDDDLAGASGFTVTQSDLRRSAELLPGPVVRERRVEVVAGLRFEIGPPPGDPGS